MKDKRQNPRVEINHIVSCTCHDGNDEYLPTFDSMLINLSTNGALIESKSPLNSKLLVLGNKSRTNPRLVKGEIVYTDTIISAEGDVFGMYRSGIKFTDLHENAKEFVVSIVMPGTSTGTPAEITKHKPQNGVPLDFDVKTINQILEDDTPTEDLLRLNELFEDDGQDGMEYDVLESIAEVLEESGDTASEPPEIMGQPNELNRGTQNQAAIPPKKRPSFLLYFNTFCFVTLCLIITAAILFHKTEYFSSLITDKKIALPFFSKTEPIFIDDIQALSPDEPKAISLINSSIKGRFVKNKNSGFHFVISGLINAPSLTEPDSIKITGRIFNQNDFLLGKANGFLQREKTPSNNEKAIKNNQKRMPFLVTFLNPPIDISRFSIDIEN